MCVKSKNIFSDNNIMIYNNNMDSHNKLEKLEEKKKYVLQLLKINYDLSTEEILDDKTIKLKEKELHKLLNKLYIFQEKMKNKYKTDVENKLNKFGKNRYENLNYELAELRNIIFSYRVYRDKAIEIKYDYDKLIEREMEILKMEKEREKRFKNNLKKETRKIHESNLNDSILDGDKK